MENKENYTNGEAQIIEAIKALGGQATVKQIAEYIFNNPLKPNFNTVLGSVRVCCSSMKKQQKLNYDPPLIGEGHAFKYKINN